MGTSFQLKGNLSLTVLVFLASSFWQAGGGPAALADDDPLDAVLEAHRQTCKKVESAIGEGSFEVYRKEAEEKDFKLRTKAKVDIQFQKDKYSFRFDYETLLQNTTYTDADGKVTKKLVEWKPDAFYVIDDGKKWMEVKFTARIRPAGCSGEIYEADFHPAFPWRDAAQLGKCFDLEGYVKNLGRDKLTVTDLPNGIRRISGWAKNSTKVRFEFDADPKAGFNITSERIFNVPNEEPALSKEIIWIKKGDIWFGEQIVEVFHFLKQEGTPDFSQRASFKYSNFNPNVEVKPTVFTLAATGMPRGTRILDHRKDAPNPILYFDGETPTPDKP
jgi:hypothetical protein